ncbi:PP2C family serine/threonine-protein phosphatase [uncultured Legionella sp.]|uniref:PP2C family serine/threonine-protein phosphatase n=1 Tax=uncultured Legionella sp. TaxID=210934 RepID=UPI002629AF62|nr:PP2C family serine/threonine-protein phosphatase [uncultured Legionella sp.]
MPAFISKPPHKAKIVQDINKEFGFGYFETMGGRSSQEDALAWHVLSPRELTAKGTAEQLTPVEIGHRLWTSYQLLDTPDLASGTTAATTIYDGKGNFITATLADAASFVVVYDKAGNALGVTRLNSVTHKPSDSEEKARIEAAGGRIIFWGTHRVDGSLAVSRAIGDNAGQLKEHGVCSEATIDVTNIDKIANDLGIDPDVISSMQVINTCDGFTDGAGNDTQSKKNHEDYLLNILHNMKSPGHIPPNELARELSLQAIRDGSTDNVSIAIQTITTDTPPVFVGVYDGHGGIEASCKVAENIGRVFKEQCALTSEQYAQQKLSVDLKKTAYERDNSDQGLAQNQKFSKLIVLDTDQTKRTEEKLARSVNDLFKLTKDYQNSLNADAVEIKPIIENLISILESNKSSAEQLKEYYSFLDKKNEQTEGQNIDLIKKDTSNSTLNFLTGIAVIAATIITGVLPGLLVIGIVYAATGKTPLDLFKSNGDRFEKDTRLIKENTGLSSGFFKSSPLSKQDKADDLHSGYDDISPDTDVKPR